MANLSVQILTVPSVARHLIENQNSFSVLVQFFTRIFNDEAEFKESGMYYFHGNFFHTDNFF